jgi:hypothetical protein
MVKSFSIRAFLALLLGLVLQVGLAAPALAGRAATPCGAMSDCGCCAKKVSCACVADSSGQETPPAPATVPERPVAVPVAAPPAALGLAANDFAVETASGFYRPDAHRAGFPGVSLAVVFCRWVI